MSVAERSGERDTPPCVTPQFFHKLGTIGNLVRVVRMCGNKQKTQFLVR